jgi:predicted GTPase
MTQAPARLVALLEDLRAFVASDARDAWPQREAEIAALDAARERLERRYTLAVVGEFSSGKSFLLNALLGKVRREGSRLGGLLAVDINPSTATITELEYAPVERATARYASGREERIPMDGLARFVAVGRDDRGGLHDATADDGGAPTHVIVGVDSPFLERGFAVADTPGLASLNPAHRRATLGYLPRADAVLYLIDTQQPFTDGDAAFLGLIGEHVRTIFILQTKIDLWRAPQADGRGTWEVAHERIVKRAARFAPNADVFAVSALEFALGTLDGDPELRDRSGFPALLEALDRTLLERALAARIARTTQTAGYVLAEMRARNDRMTALIGASAQELASTHGLAEREAEERERSLSRERDEILRAGGERREWILQQGESLCAELERALASALDVADIERIRDRNKLHVLVDSTMSASLTAFAGEVAGDTARALELVARERGNLRASDLVAPRLGGEPGVGAWSRDLAAGIRSTIVLGAIGGPAVGFVHAIGRAFAGHAQGTYMKRELGADLRERFFPEFAANVRQFVSELAAGIAGAYEALAEFVETEREQSRAERLAPIERALALDRAGRLALAEKLAAERIALAELEARLARKRALLPAPPALGSQPSGPDAAAAAPAAPEFNAAAYDRGLRPERYRIVILGALRRGKSSLIDAFAQTRLLEDAGAREALFPIHVRYGPAERAYALEATGEWHAIPTDGAIAQAARTPVLIEIPWTLPRQLVLVHAPAFDSGNAHAEEIALHAARAASEVVALFSRQLSDRELDLYARVADYGKPMLFAHTIADNEAPAERRTVVELATRYIRERGITTGRVFTISALEYGEARRAGRAPAAWNEFGALRDTLAAHAEAHMQRLAERERRASGGAPAEQGPRPAQAEASALAASEVSSRPNLKRALERFFGRPPRR